MSTITNLPLPDLRFENTFMKSLRTYAAESAKTPPQAVPELALRTESEIDLLNEQLDLDEQSQIDQPLPPITPAIVAYAIIKDQILMPLLQGILYSGLILVSKPYLRLVVLQGQKFGSYLATILGVHQFTRPRPYR
ncbi:hypothetical protein PSN45_005090 [Yamadazyma tenuis]|uniref:DUF1770-domain-containing protein n=1 Tax=Candida tenuis (strain ATCC 10573 / BCRC 21748 / CBS 615 / JCM 9827 / NBRC 10315 / NRRL Y-1498 / VKM Y-70) TaxID=590646 RepID=G3B2R9_CANTC|nr:uncharacterized protein CANTEDRAFT_103249 [Yamadazyma tenuis ATCC 10573]EGV64745.1 hypothetical protein CANTEDRAFT_103249 [Yamadazyma tenuis ATCC 10573]WEJ97536.1 hypothetical protein PSN45_005090 [Yamadazyma tenuis]